MPPPYRINDDSSRERVAVGRGLQLLQEIGEQLRLVVSIRAFFAMSQVRWVMRHGWCCSGTPMAANVRLLSCAT